MSAEPITKNMARRSAIAKTRKFDVNAPRRVGLTASLLGSAAVGTLLAALPNLALAQVVPGSPQCAVSGATVTCSGDLVTGVQVSGPPYDTLNVTMVDNPGIDPNTGNNGIEFISTSGNDISMNVDTSGTAGITTLGHFSVGIMGLVFGDGDVTLTNTGDIATNGFRARAISADALGGTSNVAVNTTGNIATTGDYAHGIKASVSSLFSDSASGSVTTTNAGNITTTGDNANGIFGVVYGADANITTTNTGAITTTGNFAHGIWGLITDVDSHSAEVDVTTSNTGNITTSGFGATGISGSIRFDGNVTTTNTGDIFTNSSGSSGIWSSVFSYHGVTTEGNVSTTNSGNITTQGINSRGISGTVDNGNVTTVNTADITTSGEFAHGIFGLVLNNGNVGITSAGTVMADNGYGISANVYGSGAIGIDVSGSVSGTTGVLIGSRNNNANANISTSGNITGTEGFAIDFQGDGHDTLNLHAGASIVGAIDFGNGNDPVNGPQNANDIDTLNMLPGFNGVVRFADSSGTDSDLESAPEIVSSNIVLSDDGLSAIVTDQTGFAASRVFLGPLTGSILNSVENGSSATALISASGASVTRFSFGDMGDGNSLDQLFFFSGFGGKQRVEAGANNAGIDHSFGGFTVGIESDIGPGRLGAFGGYGQSSLDYEFNAGGAKIDAFFGGAYWTQDYGSHSVRFAFVGGNAAHETTRNVGATVANGEFDGWFISPSVTLAAPVKALPLPAIASIRASYSAMFLNGYTETGTVVNPLAVASSTIQTFNARAQLALPKTILASNGARSQMELRFGIDALIDMSSDTVGLNVGGSGINLSAGIEDEIAGFVGASFVHTTADENFSIAASGEFKSTFGGGYEAVATLNARFRF